MPFLHDLVRPCLAPLAFMALGPLDSVRPQNTPFVSPPHFTLAEGDSGNRYPFGDGRVCRYQQVHDDVPSTPTQIAGLAFRRDIGTDPDESFAAFDVEVEIWLSTSPRGAAGIRYRFDDNHGQDKRLALGKKRLSFPPTQPSRPPHPFVYQLKFDQAFAHTGQGALCWECKVHASNTKADVYFDAVRFARPNPELALQPSGRGCRVPGRPRELTLEGRSQMDWPQRRGALRLTLRHAPASTTAAILVGWDDLAFGPVPLPWLVPGTTSAPSGPCLLRLAPALAWLLPADAAGNGAHDWPVFAIPEANGLSLIAQALAFDVSANPNGFVLSNGLGINWVAPFQVQGLTRLWAHDVDASHGVAELGSGLVTQLME